MKAEKVVPIFGNKWQVEVKVFAPNFAVRVIRQCARQNLFGGVNCHLEAKLGLTRGRELKLQNKEHTACESLRVVAGGLVNTPKILIPGQFRIHEYKFSTTKLEYIFK
jgi:hypothetical protein